MNPKSARIPAPTISALEMQEEHFWNLSLLTDNFLTSLGYSAPLEPAPLTVMLSARRIFCEGIFPKLPPYMAYSASHSKQEGLPTLQIGTQKLRHSSDLSKNTGETATHGPDTWCHTSPSTVISSPTWKSKTTAIWGKQFEVHGFKETQEATAPLLYGKHVKTMQVKAPEAVMKLLVDT